MPKELPSDPPMKEELKGDDEDDEEEMLADLQALDDAQKVTNPQKFAEAARKMAALLSKTEDELKAEGAEKAKEEETRRGLVAEISTGQSEEGNADSLVKQAEKTDRTIRPHA